MNFQETYAHLTDGDLLLVAAGRAHLVHEAALAMDSEMARRGLTYNDARTKKKTVARLRSQQDTRRPSPMITKYFVPQVRGRWLLLLLSPILLIPLLFFPRIVSEEWLLAIMFASYGVVCAISAVQPWLRKTKSFWLSLPVACVVQLVVGHMMAHRWAPRSRGELKGTAFLSILAGYAVALPLFLLLQKAIGKQNPEVRSP